MSELLAHPSHCRPFSGRSISEQDPREQVNAYAGPPPCQGEERERTLRRLHRRMKLADKQDEKCGLT